MYHYTYEITNVLNDMKYIGCRSSNLSPDKDALYLGSSKYLKNDINYYGLDNFKKEILGIFPSREEALTDEIRLHNLYEVAVNPKFYNKSKQTSTRFSRQGVKLTDEEKLKCKPHNFPSGENHWWFGKPNFKSGKTHEEIFGNEKAADIRKKYIKSMIWKSGEDHAFFGKKHTEAAKEKIAKANKGNRSRTGQTNSEEANRKLSEFRKNAHISKHNYKVTDPEGNTHLVEKIGLRSWFFMKFNAKLPSALKKSVKSGEIVQRGNWKGWKVDIIDDKNNKHK